MLPGAIRRYDRGPFSYRPGQPLGDYAFYFDHAPGRGRDDDVEVAHAAYRLRKSACFRMSQMTCTTCHNPHDAAKVSAAVCAKCHGGAHPAGGGPDCISCHMPQRRTEDAARGHYGPLRHLLGPIGAAFERGGAYRGGDPMTRSAGERAVARAGAGDSAEQS
jgi:hypothetical protein